MPKQLSKLQLLLMEWDGKAKGLDNFIKEALLIERERDNWKKATKIACRCCDYYDPDWCLEKAVIEINKEQNGNTISM